MTTISSLVRMANDIARQFGHLDHDKAVADIADHLTAFWAPRMRQELATYVAQGGAGLDPLAIDAVAALHS